MKIHVGMVIKKMDVGGIERCITRLANGMNRQRFRISVLCLDHSGPAAGWIDNPEVEIVELKHKTGNNLKVIRDLAAQFKELKIDIVQSHNWATLLETHFAARWAGGLIHSHAERGTVLGPTNGAIRQKIRALIMRWIVSRAHSTMSNAYSVADRVRATTGLLSHPIKVIPNGLAVPYSEPELEHFRRDLRAAWRVDDSAFVVGTVGRFAPVKNLALAVEGFARMLQDRPRKATLVLVGDGPCRAALEEIAARNNISDSVRFVGEQPNVWPYYAAMDVYVNTSHSEGMSQSILEAMACGKAIVATDVGDSKRMVCGSKVCGIILPKPTAEKFSDAIIALMENHLKLADYSANARRVYEECYSLQAMIQGFEMYYSQLAEEHLPNKYEATN